MLLLLVYVFAAILISFYCSISEATLLTVTPSYIARLVERGSRSGRLLREFKKDVDRPLAAILTLNTVANTAGAAGAGAQAAIVFGSAYVGVVSAILTLLILFIAEVIPKTLGAFYWRRLAPRLAPSLKVIIGILYPFVFLSKKITLLLSKGRISGVFNREEFTAMAEVGAREGQLEDKESRILRNLFRFRSLTVEDIMTPRTVVMALQENMSLEQVAGQHPEMMQFSRIPIYRESIDEITGFVLKTEILLAQAKGLQKKPLLEFKREIKAISENASVSILFEFLLDQREHIALVVDEYGGMAGIVTLEDLVETLLGLEIVDEADKAVDMRALARARWKERAKALGIITSEEKPSER